MKNKDPLKQNQVLYGKKKSFHVLTRTYLQIRKTIFKQFLNQHFSSDIPETEVSFTFYKQKKAKNSRVSSTETMSGSYVQTKGPPPLDPTISSEGYNVIINHELRLLKLTFLCHVKENNTPESS